MNKSITVTRNLLLAVGAVQLVLGILFWADIGKNLIPVHILIGSLFVLLLWTLTFLCARAAAPTGLVVLTGAWGFALLGVGFGQSDVLHGSLHWIIQLVHLLVGLTALALASVLPARVPRGGVVPNWDAASPADS